MLNKSTFCKSVLAIAAIGFVVGFSSCGDKNADRFKDAAMKLDNTHLTLEWEYDYWPDGNIRNVGGHLASLISLQELQQLLPCPLYLSGPHHNNEWNLYSDDFGYYNPEAIQYLSNLAKKVVSDKKFVAISKPLVDKYLYRQMVCMMVLHDVLYDNNVFDPDYRDYIFTDIIENHGYSEEASWYLSNIYIEEANNDGDYLFGSFNYEFLYWWARRWKDGTIDKFYEGLSTIFKAYHPEYEYTTDKYYAMEEYDDWGWDMYEETQYSCDLEDNDMISDDMRIKEDEAVDIFRRAASNLDKTGLVLANEFDYWPECGLRVMGGHLFSLISLYTLNRMLPCDLYVSGPHYYNRWNLNDPTDFGHYNPEAITYLGNLAKKVVADKKFVESTKPLVDQYLKRQMVIMKGLYDGMNNNEICPDKQAVLEDIMNREGNIYVNQENCPACELLGNLDLEDGTYVYGNTGEMFLYWWGRRNVDGTMELFHDILETVYNAYYGE